MVSKKATLDASVADAQSATAQTQDAKVNALSARDQAEAFKNATYTLAQSAASALAYQDLSAVAQDKAVTAVDVFIYDTAKSSFCWPRIGHVRVQLNHAQLMALLDGLDWKRVRPVAVRTPVFAG